MHVRRVGVGWRKQALYLYALVNFPGKAGKLVAVHFLTGIFIQSPFGSRHLGWTGGN